MLGTPEESSVRDINLAARTATPRRWSQSWNRPTADAMPGSSDGDVFDSIDFRRLRKSHWKCSPAAQNFRCLRSLGLRQPRRAAEIRSRTCGVQSSMSDTVESGDAT